MKQIVLTGSYCSKNKGDAAMRMAMAESIAEFLPGTGVSILTPFPDIDKGTYNGNPIIPCSRRKPCTALSMLLRASVWSTARRFLHVDLWRLLDTDELRTYRNADLVVDLSGDGLTEEYGIKCTLSHLMPILVGLAFGKPVFICAQTLGPFRRTAPLLSRILKRARAVAVREPVSLQNLRPLGLDPEGIRLTGDTAFMLRPCSPSRARWLLEAEGVSLDRPMLGMSITRLPGHVLEVGKHCFPNGDFEVVMARCIDRIVERLGVQVVLVSHATGPGDKRDDRIPALHVASLVRHRASVRALRGDYPPAEIKGIIGEMEMFAGMRMHSCIGALSMHVPTVAIAYGPKARGIMELANQGKHVLDLAEVCPDTMVPMLELVWAQRERVRRSLEQSMVGMQDLSVENIRIAARILGSTVEEPLAVAREA